MRRLILAAICAASALSIIQLARTHAAAADGSTLNQPAYSANGQLVLPANYREWVFLSSGYGMNYSSGAVSQPAFTNVFVNPEAYRGFLKTAKWPDRSMFVVEIYSAASRGSINKAGQYQSHFLGLDVEVKDASRASEWSYYNFDPGAKSAAVLGGSCNKCHNEHAAVEHTFIQFYPTLLDFARNKGVIKPGVDVP